MGKMSKFLSPEQTPPLSQFAEVRSTTVKLVSSLEPEDTGLQSMPDVSPPKWHLAHSTWFFEKFILQPYQTNYREFHKGFDYCFNSYYKTVGSHLPRSQRGSLSRPTLKEVLSYREYVEAALQSLILNSKPEILREVSPVLTLGIHHEQQHQELLLMDIQHILFSNPLRPRYHRVGFEVAPEEPLPLRWFEYPDGLFEIGFAGSEFSFDNERPRHRIYLEPYCLASRLVTCGEFVAFIEDHGYERPELWLSDGWDRVESSGWNAPLYWEKKNGAWWHFTLAGWQKIQRNRPVSHISYYEADAFARWVGKRLPTEAEWEVAAAEISPEGNFLESGDLQPLPPHPCPSPLVGERGNMKQLFGDVWEWTASPYTPYPRFKANPGALGEYNGKFMCNQMVLRGGSCFTPADHIRATYRNFYPPHCRWQMAGFRLAGDC
jgi:ergothioneine biosynthesis protein EgtB